jgi:hypothetical protein
MKRSSKKKLELVRTVVKKLTGRHLVNVEGGRGGFGCQATCGASEMGQTERRDTDGGEF